MSVDSEDLARKELRLHWPIVARVAGSLAFPLVICLVTDSLWVQAPLWVLAAMLAKWSLIDWGDSVIAIVIGILPFYAYFEIDSAPDWLAYIAVFIAIIQFGYLKWRLRQIENLRMLHQSR